jgi:maleylpyruvate isomerase
MTSPGSSDRRLAVDLLPGAAQRVNRTVDAFHSDDWEQPSLLPGWTRAHVVAHLALNAEAIAGVLRGLVSDEPDDHPPTMYDSDEQRERDIRDLGDADPSEIRARLLGGTTVLDDALAAMPEESWDTRVERTPGGRPLRASSLPSMRVRELEIHHVDLGGEYSTSDWSAPFSLLLLDAMTRRLDPPARFEIRPLDVDGSWSVGPDGDDAAVVTGPAADLGWWLTGRPAPDTLSCSRGELPEIGGW